MIVRHIVFNSLALMLRNWLLLLYALRIIGCNVRAKRVGLGVNG